MSYLFPHLSFQDPEGSSSSPRVPLPPKGSTILLSDTLSSPAGFVLMHFLASQLKAGKEVVLVGCGEGLSHYRAVAKKMYLNDSAVTFIDALSHLSMPTESSNSSPLQSNVAPSLFPPPQDDLSLRPLYNLIVSTLKGKGRAVNGTDSDDAPGPTETLVIIDDLSALHWMGVEVDEVSRFVRALQARSRKTSSSLLLLIHGSTSSPSLPQDTLFRTLYPSVDLFIQCRGLSSGRSGEVSGELSFTPTPLMSSDTLFPSTSPGKELQYKLGDSSVTFFAKGTGYGFL
ncbi:hypothetical protein BDY24DRAFT_383101 [Mrakia frigida]|uniref:uncharacterized protein n=1 Tax=Mrakia frigida TaxID=29902 RepID=UPI003FCBFED8